MQIIKTVAEMLAVRKSLHRETVGFVPTMGYLHAGHISLVERSNSENTCTIVSIFVNPTQFGPNEDFTRYPRDVSRDLLLLGAQNVDYVFIPEAEDLYSGGKASTVVHVQGVTEPLEGSMRPGHFDGVCTVVAKLFNIVQPTRAYFGQKDAQQLAVIKRMVQDLNFTLEIVPCPTYREPDGLAMSSRNVFLSADERAIALSISRGLLAARALWQAGERESANLIETVKKEMTLGRVKSIDYVELVDHETFAKLPQATRGAAIVVAAKVGNTRLIDNVLLD